jgi:hypothetical protein
MKNAIRSVDARTVRLEPGEAEVELTVHLEHMDPGTLLRGKLVGPRCQYASTVEVVYVAKPHAVAGDGKVALRVPIPEPSFWEPQTPFFYQGSVELWQDAARCGSIAFDHGLRQVQLGPRGLIVNGRWFLIRAIEEVPVSEEGLLAARRIGTNTLIAADAFKARELLEKADRLGFFVFVSVTDPDCDADVLAEHLKHPSYLGQIRALGVPAQKIPSGGLIGVEIRDVSDFGRAKGHFAVVDAHLAGLAMPQLIRAARAPESNGCATAILGWIETGKP